MKQARLMGKNNHGYNYYMLYDKVGVFVVGIYYSSVNRTTFIQANHDGTYIDGSTYKFVYSTSVEDGLKQWGYNILPPYIIQCSPELMEDLKKMGQDEKDET